MGGVGDVWPRLLMVLLSTALLIAAPGVAQAARPGPAVHFEENRGQADARAREGLDERTGLLRGHERCCSRCGRLMPAIHDLEERRIRDLPLFEHWVELRVLRVRVECPTCGPKLERLAWLAAYARVTRRLAESVARASRDCFGREACFQGEGGTIPFMGMLGEKFPDAQFCITGVLGPGSNAHGPNEFLHIPTGKRLTAVIARLLRDHATRDRG